MNTLINICLTHFTLETNKYFKKNHTILSTIEVGRPNQLTEKCEKSCIDASITYIKMNA